MPKTDRRVQRTRELLQKALIQLMGERGYHAITIQDIVARANVGRTTFYLHFSNKEELLLSCHESIVSELQFGPGHTLSREELLAPDAPPGMAVACQHLQDARPLLKPILQGKDGLQILRRIRDGNQRAIDASLHAAFSEAESDIPFDVLASYLAGAQIALVHWWLEESRPYPPELLAHTLHHLQRAAIRDALGLADGRQGRAR